MASDVQQWLHAPPHATLRCCRVCAILGECWACSVVAEVECPPGCPLGFAAMMVCIPTGLVV